MKKAKKGKGDVSNEQNIELAWNAGEFMLRRGEQIIILSPIHAKRLMQALEKRISDYEHEHGPIQLSREDQHFLQNLARHLFRGKKVSGNLYAVNTRKKSPD